MVTSGSQLQLWNNEDHRTIVNGRTAGFGAQNNCNRNSANLRMIAFSLFTDSRKRHRDRRHVVLLRNRNLLLFL